MKDDDHTGDHDALPDDHKPSPELLETMTPADVILFYGSIMLRAIAEGGGVKEDARDIVHAFLGMTAANFEAREACPLCVMRAADIKFPGLAKAIQKRLRMKMVVVSPEAASEVAAMLADEEPDTAARDAADKILSALSANSTKH